ncbi:unnamed protein product, partial [Dicrocoelium dendriticum]
TQHTTVGTTDTPNNVISKIRVANCGDPPCNLYRGHFSKIWVDIDPRSSGIRMDI